jgi:hypothetical protein
VQALADDNRKFLNSKSNLSRSGDACNSSPRGIVGHQGEQLDIEEQLGSWKAAGQNSWTKQSTNCGTPRNICLSREQDKLLIIEDLDDDLRGIAGYGGTNGYQETTGH